MPSVWLSNLKIRVDHLVFGGLAVVLLGSGLWVWRTHGSAQTRASGEAEEQRAGAKRQAGDKKGSAPRFTRGFHRSVEQEERGEGIVIHRPPPQADPGDLSASEAVQAYEAIVAELEAALESERELSERERAELYNRASGSLTALSAWADPNKSDERAMVDDAYLQLKSLMRELDLRPPKHNPDPPLMRR